ncbi:MAG: hypothetical protein K2N89_02835, partial [Lachnospiraceae bacterium]|nr:hypothetical protein [Lachnospiraceae bacterium]
TAVSGGNGTVNGKSEVSTTMMEGRIVTLTVKPKEKYSFDKWQIVGGDNLVTDFKIDEVGDNKYQFTMPKGNVSVKAVFKKADA